MSSSKKKTKAAERFGGPGSSHEDRVQGENEHAYAHAGPKPGEPTNPPKSTVSGGGGERDLHHSHEELPKGKGKFSR